MDIAFKFGYEWLGSFSHTLTHSKNIFYEGVQTILITFILVQGEIAGRR